MIFGIGCVESNMFLPLKDYLAIAKRCFNKYAKSKPSEDQLSTIVEYMIRADNKYRQNDGSRDKFRWYYAQFGMQTSLKKKKEKNRVNVKDLDLIADNKYSTVGNSELLELIYKHCSYRMASMIIDYYVSGYSIKELAERENVSPQRISALIKQGRIKLSQEIKDYV